MFDTKEQREADNTPGPAIGESSPNSPASRAITPLAATIILAQRGRKEILPKLRQTLDEHPELWSHFGNLCLQSQEIWIRLIADRDLFLAESIRCHLDAMRKKLAGASSAPLERLLVDRILATHVQVLYFEALEGQGLNGENPKLEEYRLKRQDQANRQFLAAVKTLASVRQLMSRTVVVELIHRQADSEALAEPIIAGQGDGKRPSRKTRTPARKAALPTRPPRGDCQTGIHGHNRLKAITP